MTAARRRATARSHEAATAPGSATDAGLRWASDAEPGIARRRAGRGFTYRDPDGRAVRDRRTLERIRSLAIPPAWTDVWIARDPRAHLQATGRDARGRKQYRYHPAFRARRERVKFDRLVAFAQALPRIRRAVDADLARRGLPREKVLALVVRLLELTLIRVGNDEYARLNRSFGLTTLRDRHVRIDRGQVRFTFPGKSGRRHEVSVQDRRLARVVARCQELPGQELMQYLDTDGVPRTIRSEDVNAYLRAVTGDDAVSAKDFRTWAGTLVAYRALRSAGSGGSAPGSGGSEPPIPARRVVADAVREVAERLGNTPAVARGSYVHPVVVDAFLDGSLRPARSPSAAGASPRDEAALLRLLRRQLDLDAARMTDRPARRRTQTGPPPRQA